MNRKNYTQRYKHTKGDTNTKIDTCYDSKNDKHTNTKSHSQLHTNIMTLTHKIVHTITPAHKDQYAQMTHKTR